MARKQLTVERGLYNELEQDFHQSLSVKQALLHLNKEGTTTRLPFRPKPGNLYLFFNPTRSDDWRADGHKWVNQGTTKLPQSMKLIKKTYHIYPKYSDTVNVRTRYFFLKRHLFYVPYISGHVPYRVFFLSINVRTHKKNRSLISHKTFIFHYRNSLAIRSVYLCFR